MLNNKNTMHDVYKKITRNENILDKLTLSRNTNNIHTPQQTQLNTDWLENTNHTILH